jgi:hypothetical protein
MGGGEVEGWGADGRTEGGKKHRTLNVGGAGWLDLPGLAWTRSDRSNGVVDNWSAGRRADLVDSWIGGLVDWWIGGLVDWWIGGLVDWWIVRLRFWRLSSGEKTVRKL